MNLDQLTSKLGKAYDTFKEAKKVFEGEDKKKKNRESGLKEAFFEAAEQQVATTLAQTSVTISWPDASEDEALAEAARLYPRWNVLDATKVAGGWYVLLEENPKYKEFTYVNTKDKRVWKKTIRDGSPYIDEDVLRQRDPGLWWNITEEKRVLKDLESLSPEDLARVQQFIYPGNPVVSLSPPRKAKPEELDEDDD